MIFLTTLTDYYVKFYLSYLNGLSQEKKQEELAACKTIYEHIYSFFRKIEISHEDALAMIDDFRTDLLVQDIQLIFAPLWGIFYK